MSSPNLPSGIYKCSGCPNEVVHSEGESFAPCGHCGRNDWKLVRKTK
jgi:DNA-directed RNA polymerase subunit RPC12/RpoP